MSSPSIIDVDALLVPIEGESPSGRSLVYEPAYDRLRKARHAEDVGPQGDWRREPKVAEWDRVVEIATDCLRRESKDLQVAAWMAEALASLHGFAGLRDGFRLLSGVQDRFWESLHPELEDGDPESRSGPAIFLNRLIPPLIRQVPLTDGFEGRRYSLLRRQESRATENAGLRSSQEMEAMIAEGKLTARQFDDAVAQTPRRFYEELVGDLTEARREFEAFDRSTDGHFGREAPSLSDIRAALDDCGRVLEPILKAKRQQEPSPEFDGPPPDTAAEGPGPAGDAESPGPTAGEGRDGGAFLIEFRERARELAEAGSLLMENRRKHAELRAELERLDREYADAAALIGVDEEYLGLLSRLVRSAGRPIDPTASGDEPG